MKIVIETIPHNQHRYPTLGDYWRDADGALQIRVSETVDPRDSFLIALHEVIEVVLCEHRGIKEEDITAFDKQHLGEDDPWVDDPGHCPEAPYHNEHVFAECIERLVALELDRNWQEYDAAISLLDAGV